MKKLILRFLFAVLFFAVGAAAAAYLLVRQPESPVAGLLTRVMSCPCCCEPQPPCAPPAAAEPSVEPVAAEPVAQPAAEPAKEAEKPVETWQGLDAENWRSGPKLNERAFRGRVTLFYVWNAEDKNSLLLLPRMEELWQSFRGKQLVVVGSHRGGVADKVAAAAKSAGVTFPVYEGARYFKEPAGASKATPYLYAVDHEGRVVYRGRSERAATEALVDALVKAELARKAQK